MTADQMNRYLVFFVVLEIGGRNLLFAVRGVVLVKPAFLGR